MEAAHSLHVILTFLFGEGSVVAAREEAVDVGLGVLVFVAVAGVAEEVVVKETFQVAVLDAGSAINDLLS
mgnify:CR=1 FL=1